MTKAYAVYFCQGLDENGEPDVMLETVWATKEKAQAYIDRGKENDEEVLASGWEDFGGIDHDDFYSFIKEVDIEYFPVPEGGNYLHV